MSGEEDAVAAMVDQGVEWLGEGGMKAGRRGFAGFLDYPYGIDNYNALPSFLLRGNPDFYHRYFKNARFLTEKGQVDYTAPLTPEILARYREMLEAARRMGVVVKSWREYGFLAAVDVWTDVPNERFSRHWGWNRRTRDRVRPLPLPPRPAPP